MGSAEQVARRKCFLHPICRLIPNQPEKQSYRMSLWSNSLEWGLEKLVCFSFRPYSAGFLCIWPTNFRLSPTCACPSLTADLKKSQFPFPLAAFWSKYDRSGPNIPSDGIRSLPTPIVTSEFTFLVSSSSSSRLPSCKGSCLPEVLLNIRNFICNLNSHIN